MLEKEKILRNQYFFISSYGKNIFKPNLEVITVNKHLTILFQKNNDHKNAKTPNHKNKYNYLLNKKRNDNNGKLMKKTSISNFFPPLINNNRAKLMPNMRYEKGKEKEKVIDNYNNYSSFGKDKYLSFRLTNTKKLLNEENVNKNSQKILKLSNIKLLQSKKNDECNDNFSLTKKSNFFDSSIRNELYSIKNNRFKKKESKTDKSYRENKINEIKKMFKDKKFLSDKKRITLKYCVYPGNNSKLIENVMEHRKAVWEKVPTSHHGYCDFVWAPLSSSIDFKSIQLIHQCVNHIQFNEEISNKMRLYANLLRHCEKKKIDIYKIFPFTICLTLSHHSFDEQLINFKELFRNIYKYTPKSEVVFSSLFNALLNKKIGTSQTINIPKTFNSGKNMWIIKPVNLNRGRCIKILNNLEQIIKEMKAIQMSRKIKPNDDENKNNNNLMEKSFNSVKCDYIMIQKYLERPLLYMGRKFDIRIWVMFITNRKNDVYIFKEGHLKASSLKYNPNSIDKYVHLTNYSVQKHNIYFSTIEIGNEIPFHEFQKELDLKRSGKSFKKDIYPKIVKIIRLTGGAAFKGRMDFMNVKNCFEIFGYDFILDENYRPFLLEINTNPGLEISSPLINQLLPRMIDDAFKLTIDEEFTMSSEFQDQDSRFPVDYYKNSENMWEKYTII